MPYGTVSLQWRARLTFGGRKIPLWHSEARLNEITRACEPRVAPRMRSPVSGSIMRLCLPSIALGLAPRLTACGPLRQDLQCVEVLGWIHHQGELNGTSIRGRAFWELSQTVHADQTNVPRISFSGTCLLAHIIIRRQRLGGSHCPLLIGHDVVALKLPLCVLRQFYSERAVSSGILSIRRARVACTELS